MQERLEDRIIIIIMDSNYSLHNASYGPFSPLLPSEPCVQLAHMYAQLPTGMVLMSIMFIIAFIAVQFQMKCAPKPLKPRNTKPPTKRKSEENGILLPDKNMCDVIV